MDENNLVTSISELFLGNGIIISLACMTVGMFLKGTFKKVPNKYIPFINVIIAIVTGFLIPNTYADKDVVSKVIILSFLGLSSVGLYESLTTIVKKRFDIDLTEIFSFDESDSDSDTVENPDVLLDSSVSEDDPESDKSKDDTDIDPGE